MCLSVSYEDRLQDMKYFQFMLMHVCNPFGSLLGAIQMDDAYVSWSGLWQGPINDRHNLTQRTTHTPHNYKQMETQFKGHPHV